MPIPHSIVDTLNWWLENIPTSSKSVLKEKPQITLYTDASSKGWGATIKQKVLGQQETGQQKSKALT